MDHALHTRIVSFIWGIADDVLRDVYVRGKYRDVILPMTVLRRLDAVLEPTKQAVLDMKATLDKQGIVNQDEALRSTAGQAFYNTSAFTLRDLKNRANAQTLQADFLDYLDGFSPNVQEILVNFNFRNQVPKLVKADALGFLIGKYLDPTINFSPKPVGTLPALDNHAMGTIFEELVRKFNEENNEEAGEHWTPRDVVKVMTRLMFMPIADQIESGTYLLYDCACGTGGMLTVAEETLKEIGAKQKKQVATHLYGQEINDETYAICKADMLMKGEGDGADNIVGGGERSTLSNDAFPGREFDFMLANPPYGKSWKKDLERMGGKGGIKDPRFMIEHAGDPEYSLITRSSDGQMLFLANMLSKMKRNTKLGSRIAEVHNGSSLFTGDAGQGESNIRRWIIENDWLDAIVALPLNIFYNTGIATYIWVLSNRKPEHRKGKVQLIDATQWYQPLRKNLGSKNCELGEGDIKRVVDAFLEFKETEQSKIFPNAAFGYWKVKVERPLRLRSQFTRKAIEPLRFWSGEEDIRAVLYDKLGEGLFEDFESVRKQLVVTLDDWGKADEEEAEGDDAPKAKALPEKKRNKLLDRKTWERDARLLDLAGKLLKHFGDRVFMNYNVFKEEMAKAAEALKLSPAKGDLEAVMEAVSVRDEKAAPVVKKVVKKGKADPLRGLVEAEVGGKKVVVEYEPDSELRDFEQIPLLEPGGIEAFIRREVLPYAPDAWIDEGATKTGYEVSFNRYFYKPQPLRSLEEIPKDIVALEKEAEGLLNEIDHGMSENKTIEGKGRTVRELLKGVKYAIDFYQRDYKWQSKQIRELVDDLGDRFMQDHEVGNPREAVDDYGHYFLGSIIVSKRDGFNYLVDGQQRLTSLSLLLIYLRNLQKDQPESTRVNVDELIFSEKYGKKSFNMVVDERLACMEGLYDNGTYDATDRPESVQNIVQRYNDIVDCFPDELRGDTLPFFIDWLLENVHLVEIVAYSDEDAYTIFETMNDRGLSLTPTDMLKGYLLANITDADQRNRANTAWKERIRTLNDLGKDMDADFFKNWFRSQYANKIRERKKGAKPEEYDRMGTEFHRWFRDAVKGIGLEHSADYYRFIDRDFEFYSRQYLHLVNVARTYTAGWEHVYYNAQHDFTLQYMLLLAPLKPSDDEAIIQKKVKLVAMYISNVLAWRIWNYRSIGHSSMQYSMFSRMKAIRGMEVSALAEYLMSELGGETETFRAADNFRMHKMNSWPVHLLLARLTDYIETRSGGPSRFTEFAEYKGANRYEVEHIWANKPDRHKDEFDNPADFQEYRNRIGALLLLPKKFNGSYGALPYSDKLPHYNTQNLLARSLHPQCYERNPGFLQFVEYSRLPFHAHERFKKADIEERTLLYQRLAEKVWSPLDLMVEVGVVAPDPMVSV